MSSAPDRPAPGPATNATAAKPNIPDYELVRIVGRGSYGDVWLARSVTGSWRAIKVVWRDRFANAEPFEREFRGLKEFADVSLDESSQMALLHVGRNDAAGFFYSVMELADDAERGRNIDPASYVPLTFAELRARRDRIPADECARLGVTLARALASLHRRGLVHRDVKPSNVILVNGAPKLADVGLVAPSASARTFVGTEGYVPPEGPGSPSADVFALAKVLYELSTGHDRQEFPKLPADLARFPDCAALLELNEVFLRACGPTSAQRYRDGAAILADLTALNAGVSLRTRRLAAFLLRLAAAIALLVALGFGARYWQNHSGPPPTAAGISPYSVAVLPFANATGKLQDEYLGGGLSDEILHALERERDLRVTGSWSSFWATTQKIPPTEIAKRLRVAQLVEGSVQRVGAQLHLEVHLTRGVDGVSEPIGTFAHAETDLFALEDEVARAVAQKIQPRVTMPELARSTTNLEAYREFLRGRALQVRGVGYAADAAKYFEHAVTLDPNFAVAWARLADARRIEAQKNSHGKWPDNTQALDAAEQAVKAQPDLALALTVRGFIRGVGRIDPAEGLRDLARAEQLSGPNAETRMTRFLLNWFNGSVQGLLPDAREAIASNPENIERNSVIKLALWYLGDFGEADRLYQVPKDFQLYRYANDFVARVQVRRTWRGADAARRLAERTPHEPAALEMRVRMLAELGRTAEAVKLLEGATEPLSLEAYDAAGMNERARALAEIALPALRGEFAEFPDKPRGDSDLQLKDEARSRLIAAEIVLGHRDTAIALLDAWWQDAEKRAETRKVNRRSGGLYIANLPRYYARLGKPETALQLLEEFAADGRCWGYDLRDSACFAPLRDNPRFQELRRQAEAWAATQPDPVDDPPATARR